MWDVGLTGTNAVVLLNGVATALDPLMNEEASMFGFGIVQHVDAAAMELYLSYRHYTANDITDVQSLLVGGNVVTDHDIRYDVIMTGARIKF